MNTPSDHRNFQLYLYFWTIFNYKDPAYKVSLNKFMSLFSLSSVSKYFLIYIMTCSLTSDLLNMLLIFYEHLGVA